MNANRLDQLGNAAMAVIRGELTQANYLSIARALKFSAKRAEEFLNNMRTLRFIR